MTPTLPELRDRLLARTGRGAVYGLDRMRNALATVGHPERDLPVVHVAGTNGKGSVCAMLDAMARAAGLSVGTFTSPHLCRLNERIRLDGQPIDDDRFAHALAPALAVEPPVTFFEAITLAGFLALHDAKIDLAVLEVGLGGRLDATNVIPPPRCAVITSIGHDHTRILGETLPEIASEKAGIIKPGAPVVIGVMAADARSAIVARAAAVRSGPITAIAAHDEDAEVMRADGLAVVQLGPSATGLSLTGAIELTNTLLGLRGAHQHRNAAVAVAAAHVLGLPAHAITTGLATARWAGRLERLEHDGVTVLLDCAHNLHAAAALDEAIAELEVERTSLVFGALGDKQWRDMLLLIGKRASRRFYCTPLDELAGRLPATPEELAGVLPGTTCASKEQAIDAALAAARPGDTVIVTGSIFVVGAIRAYLTGEACDDAVAL